MSVHWVDGSQKFKATFGFGVTALCGIRISASNMEPSEGTQPNCRDCNRLLKGRRQ